MSRFEPVVTAPAPERAVLVGVDWRSDGWPIERSLDELERLADTAGAETVARITQRLDRPVPKSYIGSGKVEELKGFVNRLEADIVIFDDDLSPSQQSFLERALGEPIKVVDRTALILDIFGLHARTREGRLQVQLAQLQYLLPRLRGMWSHLAKEQTRGGIGSRFGQGESQLEIDRRMIRNKIAQLRRELREVEKRRDVQSKLRKGSLTFRIALAGYTNAGKSSLLNRVCGPSVLAQDKLFATLDPTTRSLSLPGGRMVAITDTVGFIQKLPHGLVESFKSTLSEVRDADLILKVVDISDGDHQRHIDAVERVLNEVGAGDRPALTVYNKIDRLSSEEVEALKLRMPGDLFFSAATGEGLAGLLDRVILEASACDIPHSCEIPYREGALLSSIRSQGNILSEEYLEDRIRLVCKVPRHLVARIKPYITE